MKKWKIAVGVLSIMILGYISRQQSFAETIAESHEPRIFGSTYMTRSNPFFDILHESIEEIVEANGDILITRNPLQDQEKQNEQIMEMLDEGIEVLFLNPVDWKSVEPALEACKEADVPVINVDTMVEDQNSVITYIETDNYQAGQECAKDMVERLSQAKIVILDNPTQTSISNRVEGFLDVLKPYGDRYEVVYQAAASGEFEVAAKVMGDFLDTETDFDVVLGGNDPTALGALAAMQQHYQDDEGILIYGIDGSPDFKAMIESGYVTATSSQSPKNLGNTAANVAYRYLDGERIQKYIKLPSTLISAENLDQYEINGWQ